MTARRAMFLAVVAAAASVQVPTVAASDGVGAVPTTPGITTADLGDVSIRSAEAPDRALDGGDASTPFVVTLPSGATCPGDSAHGQWRVQTFMVPDGVDIAHLHYGGIGPDGPDQFALFTADATQRSWDSQVLPMNDVPDAATPLPDLPAFSFAAISVVPVSVGRYRIGVACTLFGETAQYWDTTIEVSGSSEGTPDDFRWTVVARAIPVAAADHPTLVRTLGTVALVLLVAVISALLWSQRRLRRPQLRINKEPR